MNRILVSCPTSKSKNYCFEEWLENTMSFKHPLYDIAVFDNTPDNGENTKYLNDTFKRIFGRSEQFKAFHSKVQGVASVIERMTISSNEMRDYFLSNKQYDKLLSLESDVFPEPPIIENLMFHRRHVVGALYFRDEGQWRKLTIQNNVRQIQHGCWR